VEGGTLSKPFRARFVPVRAFYAKSKAEKRLQATGNRHQVFF
jgi:hypothetical protein